MSENPNLIATPYSNFPAPRTGYQTSPDGEQPSQHTSGAENLDNHAPGVPGLDSFIAHDGYRYTYEAMWAAHQNAYLTSDTISNATTPPELSGDLVNLGLSLRKAMYYEGYIDGTSDFKKLMMSGVEGDFVLVPTTEELLYTMFGENFPMLDADEADEYFVMFDQPSLPLPQGVQHNTLTDSEPPSRPAASTISQQTPLRQGRFQVSSDGVASHAVTQDHTRMGAYEATPAQIHEFLRKLANRYIDYGGDPNVIFEIPANFELWYVPRTDGTKDNEFLYGHKHHRCYRSYVEFLPHFWYLVDLAKGVQATCTCVPCKKGPR